jgi:hypothetical protein
MILESMIAAAMAGALALPVASAGGSAGTARHAADTPPPAAATNPLLALAGAGFAAIGDLANAVPIVGPLATGIAEGVVCATESIPLFGLLATATVNKYASDQKQKSACAASGNASSSSSGPSSSGPAPSRPAPSGAAPSGTASSGAAPSGTASSGPAPSTATGSSGSDRGSNASDHGASATGHSTTSDHSGSTDHATVTHRLSAGVTFPKDPFQIRQGMGAGENCLITGTPAGGITPAKTGRCDASAAWVYQSGTGELHPASSRGTCLISQTRNLAMVTIGSCATVTSWTKHWYLSGTGRLFVKDADEYGSWRFLGAPGALVVGGVSQTALPGVPVWSFPAP